MHKLCAAQARLLAMAQDLLIGDSPLQPLSGPLLAAGALQLLPLAVTRASTFHPRARHILQAGGRGHFLVADIAGLGLGSRASPQSAAALARLMPRTITPASALHPTTRHVYQAARLVRLTRRALHARSRL